MRCPKCGSTNTGDAGAATYHESVCKDCNTRFSRCQECRFEATTNGDHICDGCWKLGKGE